MLFAKEEPALEGKPAPRSTGTRRHTFGCRRSGLELGSEGADVDRLLLRGVDPLERTILRTVSLIPHAWRLIVGARGPLRPAAQRQKRNAKELAHGRLHTLLSGETRKRSTPHAVKQEELRSFADRERTSGSSASDSANSATGISKAEIDYSSGFRPPLSCRVATNMTESARQMGARDAKAYADQRRLS